MADFFAHHNNRYHRPQGESLMSVFRRSPPRHATIARDLSVLRYFAWSIAAIGGLVAAYPFALVATALDQVTAVDVAPLIGENRPPAPLPPVDGAKGTAINILLMGSDARTGANAGIGGYEAGGMRNDTTIIMHISADRTRVELISIPRDSRVRIPDCQLFDGTTAKGWTGKFNIAFANGGRHGNPAEAAACTINAVEALTDIYIHYYAVVDFSGFIGMIDAIGGVPMCIPHDIYSSKAKLNVKAGPQVLDGWTALAYARLRTAESSGGTINGSDIQRIDRQQQLLANTAEAALAQNILFRPTELQEFLSAGAASMTMSPGLADINYLVGLTFSLRNVQKENIVFVTVPWKGHPNGSDVVWTSAAYTLFAQVIADSPISGRSVADTSTAADPEPAPSLSPGAEPAPEPSPSADPNNPNNLLTGCTA